MAPISVFSAVAMLFQRNAVHAALLLIVNFFTLAVFFLILGSPFLFVVQIIVYAGAIMVLFLFVIMLLGVDRHESLVERIRGQRPLALVLAAGLVAEVVLAIRLGVGISTRAAPNFDQVVNKGGNVLGMMPHPERCADPELGGDDGLLLFRSAITASRGLVAS